MQVSINSNLFWLVPEAWTSCVTFTLSKLYALHLPSQFLNRRGPQECISCDLLKSVPNLQTVSSLGLSCLQSFMPSHTTVAEIKIFSLHWNKFSMWLNWCLGCDTMYKPLLSSQVILVMSITLKNLENIIAAVSETKMGGNLVSAVASKMYWNVTGLVLFVATFSPGSCHRNSWQLLFQRICFPEQKNICGPASSLNFCIVWALVWEQITLLSTSWLQRTGTKWGWTALISTSITHLFSLKAEAESNGFKFMSWK